LTLVGGAWYIRGMLVGMYLIAGVWLIHIGIGAILSLPIIIYYKSQHQCYLWELLVFIVPFVVYFIFQQMDSKAGGMSNFIIESGSLGALIPIAVFLRFILCARFKPAVLTPILIIVLCGAAIALRVFVPGLPD